MIESYLYEGDYKHLMHQALIINDTKEHIVWVYENNKFYYRCYGLPETISFCETILLCLNSKNTLNELKHKSTFSNKEKLILESLISFSKRLS